MEEKEAELKREYSRLHDRYTELFKTHVDYMERTKMLVGSSERLENTTGGRGPARLPSLGLAHMSRSSGPLSYGFQSLEASINAEDVQEENSQNTVSLKSEMQDSSSEAAIETSDKSLSTDHPVQENKTTAISRREFAKSKFNVFPFIQQIFSSSIYRQRFISIRNLKNYGLKFLLKIKWIRFFISNLVQSIFTNFLLFIKYRTFIPMKNEKITDFWKSSATNQPIFNSKQKNLYIFST